MAALLLILITARSAPSSSSSSTSSRPVFSTSSLSSSGVRKLVPARTAASGLESRIFFSGSNPRSTWTLFSKFCNTIPAEHGWSAHMLLYDSRDIVSTWTTLTVLMVFTWWDSVKKLISLMNSPGSSRRVTRNPDDIYSLSPTLVPPNALELKSSFCSTVTLFTDKTSTLPLTSKYKSGEFIPRCNNSSPGLKTSTEHADKSWSTNCCRTSFIKLVRNNDGIYSRRKMRRRTEEGKCIKTSSSCTSTLSKLNFSEFFKRL